MTVHPCNPSTQEAEAGGYHGVQGWLGSQGEIVCPNKNNETLKLKKKKNECRESMLVCSVGSCQNKRFSF